MFLVGQRAFDDDSLANTPAATGDEVDTQPRWYAKEQQAHHQSHDAHHFLRHGCLFVSRWWHEHLLLTRYSTTTTTGSTLKYGPNQPVPRPDK